MSRVSPETGRINLVVNQDYWNPTGVGVKGCLGALCLCGSAFALLLLLAYFLSLVLIFFFWESFVSSLKFSYMCTLVISTPQTPLQISPRLDNLLPTFGSSTCFAFLVVTTKWRWDVGCCVAGVTSCGACAAHHSCSKLTSGRAVWYLEDGISQRSPHPLLGDVPELWGVRVPLRAGLNSHSSQHFGQFWISALMATHRGRGVPGRRRLTCFLWDGTAMPFAVCVVRDGETSHPQRLLSAAVVTRHICCFWGTEGNVSVRGYSLLVTVATRIRLGNWDYLAKEQKQIQEYQVKSAFGVFRTTN